MVRYGPYPTGGPQGPCNSQIESRRWRTASIAARTRDRSALASREKCPCVSKVTLLFVAALLLAAPPDVPPPAAWDSEVGGRTEVGFGHACAV